MVARAGLRGQTARVTRLLHSLPLMQVLAYGAVGGVLLATIVVIPAAGAFDIPPLNPFGAESSEGEVVAVEVTGRQQSGRGSTDCRRSWVRIWMRSTP